MILSVMFDEEKNFENRFLRDLELKDIGEPVTINLKDLFTDFTDRSFYTYRGSLTRPPC